MSITILTLLIAAISCGQSSQDPTCNFNNGLCSWSQSKSDKFDWTLKTGSTPSSNTGPSSGHGGQVLRGRLHDHPKPGSFCSYIYIETSSPRKQGDNAILTFRGENCKSLCFSFYYNMFGRTIGTLNVYNKGNLIWRMTGDQGTNWKKANLPIGGESYDLKIEGIRGSGFTGDIAIDDISVTDGPCVLIPPTPPTQRPTVFPSSCGFSPGQASRVIGGVDAVPGNWPWQIALLKGTSKGFSCGGSLIAPDWIITAAHCISSGQPGSYYTIRLGDHNRYVQEGTEEDIPGRRVFVHPNYNTPYLSNDIALIQLIRPAKLSVRVGTVCLPSHNEVVPTSAKCFITGWGKIKHPGSSHHILQQARLPPVTNDVCARKLATSPGGSSLQITPQMICAGVEGTILSGCHGDSGGPYVCQGANGKWFLQGAVSWGSPTCSAVDRYTVFARVAQFRNWINQYVRT